MRESKLKKLYRNTCLNEFELNEIKELKEQIKQNNQEINNLKSQLDLVLRNTNELVYSNVFHDTIKNSEWFKNIPLSLTSWAIGYNFAYILYRTLNEIKPKKILELGLGQSTKIVNEYAKHFKNVKHDIVEHNKEWTEFFKNSTDMSDMVNFHLLTNIKRKYNGVELNSYKGFKKEFEKQKFDLMLIDAPVGGTEYARMDILDILPECLEKSFVIIIDDCQRIGEKRTIELLEKKLRDNNITYCSGYLNKGVTDAYICTSDDLRYLCSI